MSNKNTTNEDTKISVFTPKVVKAAFDSLPYHFAKPAQEILKKKFDAGTIEKVYSTAWIAKVRNGMVFNEDILNALVEVGQAEQERKRMLKTLQKEKTPSTK